MADGLTASDVRAAGEAFVAALNPVADGDWTVAAGPITWSCTETLRHVGDCLIWYAMNLSARTSRPDLWEFGVHDAAPANIISLVDASASLLADVVDAAPPEARGWHPFGIADRSGFAGMGCDEVLVHAFDIATGLGAPYDPPRSVCARVVNRMFPWAPQGFDPWETLLWCNGRADLPGHDRPNRKWLWHCEPLADWDGTIPTM